MIGKFTDIQGRKFTRWTVIKRHTPIGIKPIKWECKCDCGNIGYVGVATLLKQESKSCGCLRVEAGRNKKLTHGMTRLPFYNTWVGIKARCYNKNLSCYKHYGGRGIKVCDRWLEDDGFVNFKKDMFQTWASGLSLDRIDNNGDYSPENCRWATNKTQSNNTRWNRNVSINGETLSVTNWAEKLGIDAQVIYNRLRRGWEETKAVLSPAQLQYSSKNRSKI